MVDLDPHYEWIDVTPMEQPPGTEFIRGMEIVPDEVPDARHP